MPEKFPAGFHDHRASRIAWLDLDEHLPDVAELKSRSGSPKRVDPAPPKSDEREFGM
jgi:hypothetical protein